jgi:hypothetical protein
MQKNTYVYFPSFLPSQKLEVYFIALEVMELLMDYIYYIKLCNHRYQVCPLDFLHKPSQW